MSELLGVSAVDSPGLAGVEERGQSVEPRLSEVADVCAVFGCNNDRLLPEKYTVKDHISNTKLDGLWVVSFCGFILKIYSFNTPH